MRGIGKGRAFISSFVKNLMKSPDGKSTYSFLVIYPIVVLRAIFVYAYSRRDSSTCKGFAGCPGENRELLAKGDDLAYVVDWERLCILRFVKRPVPRTV